MKRGFITLLTTLFMVVVGGAAAISVLLLGVGFSRMSFARQQSAASRALADTCADESLEQIRDSTPFTGSGNITLGQGICSYTVTSGGGQNRTVTASGTVGTVVRKVSISIDKINPNINVTSWQEVP